MIFFLTGDAFNRKSNRSKIQGIKPDKGLRSKLDLLYIHIKLFMNYNYLKYFVLYFNNGYI